MIEMLAELIAGVLGLIKKGDYKQASEKLGRIYYDMLKEDAAYFRVIPEDKLTYKLLQEHNYTNGHLEILAELFYVQAELFYAENDKTNALELYEKYIVLHNFLIQDSKTFSIDKEDIERKSKSHRLGL